MAGKSFSTSTMLKKVTGTDAAGELLALEVIHLDGGTQPRAAISADVVDEYAEAMREGVAFPPVVVYNDGETYWLADGFHRYHAAQAAGLDSIRAEVKSGQLREAVLYSVSANADHGLRRTNADKRRSVLRLLEDPEWSKWSDREIARRCRVHHDLVSTLRRERSPAESASEESGADERTYTTKHGTTTTMNTGKIREANQRRAQPVRRDVNAEAVFGGGPVPDHDPALRPDQAQTYTPPTARAAAQEEPRADRFAPTTARAFRMKIGDRVDLDLLVNRLDQWLTAEIEFEIDVREVKRG